MSALKLLVFLLAVLAGVWLWRRGRQRVTAASQAQPRTRQGTVEMVRCAHCGTHVPTHDALPGHKGLHYCSAAHRKAGEGAA